MRRGLLAAALAVIVSAVSGCATSQAGDATGRSASSDESGSGSGEAPSRFVAIDVYTADVDARLQASRNPADADLTWVRAYETGPARARTERMFAYLKAHHVAYRGAAPRFTTHVRAEPSATEVVLTSCVLRDKSAAWLAYDTTTGKTLPTSPRRDMFPPYPQTVLIEKSSPRGPWLITSVTKDVNNSCDR
jgi:hypothetical protein